MHSHIHGSAFLWGLYPLHLFAVIVGSIVFLMLLIMMAFMLTRKVFPWCGQWYATKTSAQEEQLSEDSEITDIEEEEKEHHVTEAV